MGGHRSRRWPHEQQLTAIAPVSSGGGHPPSKFAELLAHARAGHLSAVAHAVQTGPPAYIEQGAERAHFVLCVPVNPVQPPPLCGQEVRGCARKPSSH